MVDKNITNRSFYRSRAAAAVTAGLLLFAAGLGYRALSGRLDRAPDQRPLPKGTLKQLPLTIGSWVGRDQEIDAAILKRADVDDHLTRVYRGRSNSDSVSLWIAYGIRARDLMPHRPEVCYPGAGWTLRGEEHVTFPVADREPVAARLMTFASGTIDPRPLEVLTYYIVDGETCEDVSLLRSKAWRGQTAIRYMCQIQITRRVETFNTAVTEDPLRAFASATFPLIRDLLRDAVARTDRDRVQHE